MELKCNQILIRNRILLTVFSLALHLSTTFGCQGKGNQVALPQPVEGSLAKQISLIEAAKASDGVNEELWRSLTSRLSSELQNRYATQGTRLVSSAPSSDASKTSLSINNGTLSFHYFNQADYDQNGEVNLADLTPIALNIGITGPFPVDSAKAVVDGDGNTEINLADITPIAVNFLNSALGGYNIYRSLDPADAPTTNSGPNGGGALFVGNLPLSAASGNKATQRSSFAYEITAPVVGAYYWVRPTDGQAEGTPSNLARLDPPPNIDPIAVATATPDAGEAPLTVLLDGSGSYDPDGFIVDYSWDFNGSIGGFVWIPGGTEPTMEHTYTDTGTYLTFIKVVDDDGAEIISPVTVTVGTPPNEPPVAALSANPTSGDGPLTVNFDGSLSNDPDGEIVKFEWDWDGDGTYDYDSGLDATPGHTYSLAGDYNATVRVTDNEGATDTASVLCSVASGAESWHTFTIKNDVAYYDIDLAEINGKPAVAFSEPGDANQIYYFQSNDANGATWGTMKRIGHVKVDWLTLVTTDGNPAVIYRHDGFSGGFVRAADADGNTWGNEVNIEPGFGMMTSTTRWAGAVVGGNPTLGYKGEIGGQDGLFYQSATTPEGTTWNPPNLVFLVGPAFYPALHEVSGNPAMVFVNPATELCYVRATNSEGTIWPTPIVIGPENSFGMFPEITTVNGNPAILYPGSGGFNAILNFVRATDANGTSWGSPELLYSNLEFPPSYPNLAVINGIPAVAFGSANPRDLMYSPSADQNGASWGPGERVDIYFNSQVPLADINGHPAIAYLRNGIVSADLMFAIYY